VTFDLSGDLVIHLRPAGNQPRRFLERANTDSIAQGWQPIHLLQKQFMCPIYLGIKGLCHVIESGIRIICVIIFTTFGAVYS
jgi:hypothetical protein